MLPEIERKIMDAFRRTTTAFAIRRFNNQKIVHFRNKHVNETFALGEI